MTPKSNNSQHQMTSEQAAAGIRGSAADHWTNLVIQQIRDGEREPLFTPGTFASAGETAPDLRLRQGLGLEPQGPAVGCGGLLSDARPGTSPAR